MALAAHVEGEGSWTESQRGKVPVAFHRSLRAADRLGLWRRLDGEPFGNRFDIVGSEHDAAAEADVRHAPVVGLFADPVGAHADHLGNLVVTDRTCLPIHGSASQHSA